VARTILVTGGRGFIGVPTVSLLVERGYEVVVLDNGTAVSTRGADGLEQAGVTVVAGDIRDRSCVDETVHTAQPWGVIHLAALHMIQYCMNNPAETVEVNLAGTRNVVDACAAAGVRRLVFASTSDVYRPGRRRHDEDDPLGSGGVYGATKMLGESLVASLAGGTIGTVIARIFNVYGPGDANPHVIPDILAQLGGEQPRLALGNVDAVRDYIFVADVAQAFADLLERDEPSFTVNVGTGVGTSVRELIAAIERALGCTITVTFDRSRLRTVEQPVLVGNPERLKRAVGVHPRRLEDGLPLTLEDAGLVG
jgi:UDP-glucose 4-epimerase